jgi:hypothetical protein
LEITNTYNNSINHWIYEIIRIKYVTM